jgi:hypothetical protein
LGHNYSKRDARKLAKEKNYDEERIGFEVSRLMESGPDQFLPVLTKAEKQKQRKEEAEKQKRKDCYFYREVETEEAGGGEEET